MGQDINKVEINSAVKIDDYAFISVNGKLRRVKASVLKKLFCSDLSDEIAVERARINTLARLEEGSTTGDAELAEARVDYTGHEWSNVGEHIRGVSNQLSNEIDDLQEENIICFSLSGETGTYDYNLHAHNYTKGDIIHLLIVGNGLCNIVGMNGENAYVLLHGVGSGSYTITLEEDIKRLGIFLSSSADITVYLIGEYHKRTYDEIIDKINRDMSNLTVDLQSKVYSDEEFYHSDNVEKTDAMLYKTTSLNESGITKVEFSGGNCAISLVYGSASAKINGRGWNYSYGYFGYGFLDYNKKLIQKVDIENGTQIIDLIVEIPENAYYIIVNGDDLSPANIEVLSAPTNFKTLYQHYADEKTNCKLITLGDSITMLGTGDRGWIKYFIEKTGCELIANVAMNSAVLADNANTVYDGNPQQSNQTNNTLGNQVQKIINNDYETPDVIMIAIGTNGGINITSEQIKNTYYDENKTLIPLENVNRKTDAGAYRYATETLHELYPNAIIFWCTPIMGYQSIRSAENAMTYAKSLRIATEYSGQIMIDTIRCGINGVNEVNGANGEYLIDGLHPNVNGAKKIGYYNASKVKPFLN